MRKAALAILIGIVLFSSCSREVVSPHEPPWPDWAFSHWVWEDESTQQSAIALVNGYLQRNIPVGAVIIDSPWETGYNTFEWDPVRYPDPPAMIKWFHERGVRVFVWTTSMINIGNAVEKALHDEGSSKGYFMTAGQGMSPAIIDWWKGPGSFIDYFNPDAVAWWHSLMDKTLALGIDGWKVDFTDNDVFLAPYSPYLKRNVQRLEYSHAYYRDFFTYTREKLGRDRVITARPVDAGGSLVSSMPVDLLESLLSYAPRDINWAGWVGDQEGTFEGMKKALENMLGSSRLNYIAFGSDIGGYNVVPAPGNLGREKELFIRWAQLGALCPVMENGGGGTHEPWKFDEYYGGTETTDIYQSFVKLHYALIPYLMREGAWFWRGGASLMRFVSAADYQYRLGRDIFVAPILSPGGTVTVEFPKGSSWVYVFDRSRLYAGGTSQELTFPLAEFPVYLRKGSIIEKTLIFQ